MDFLTQPEAHEKANMNIEMAMWNNADSLDEFGESSPRIYHVPDEHYEKFHPELKKVNCPTEEQLEKHPRLMYFLQYDDNEPTMVFGPDETEDEKRSKKDQKRKAAQEKDTFNRTVMEVMEGKQKTISSFFVSKKSCTGRTNTRSMTQLNRFRELAEEDESMEDQAFFDEIDRALKPWHDIVLSSKEKLKGQDTIETKVPTSSTGVDSGMLGASFSESDDNCPASMDSSSSEENEFVW